MNPGGSGALKDISRERQCAAHYRQQEVKLALPPSLLILLSSTFSFPDFQARQRKCQRGNGKMKADK